MAQTDSSTGISSTPKKSGFISRLAGVLRVLGGVIMILGFVMIADPHHPPQARYVAIFGVGLYLAGSAVRISQWLKSSKKDQPHE